MIQFTYTGPLGNHGGESRFPLFCSNGRSGGRTTKLFLFILKKIMYFSLFVTVFCQGDKNLAGICKKSPIASTFTFFNLLIRFPFFP